MNFKDLESKKTISVFSSRIAMALINEFGLSELCNIAYLDRKPEEPKKKVFIFRNSPGLLTAFSQLAYNPDFDK